MPLRTGDLEVQLSFAFVCYGKMREFDEIRTKIETEHPDVKLVFNTVSAEHLYILKRSALNEEQVKVFEEKEAKKQK
jgi:hypothetical protein